MPRYPKTRERRGWSLRLTHPLTLEDQTRLATLADARAVVVERLTNRVEDAALSEVLKLLLIAARSGTLSDRKAATDQLEMVLKGAVPGKLKGQN
jgi:hypothetical protein